MILQTQYVHVPVGFPFATAVVFTKGPDQHTMERATPKDAFKGRLYFCPASRLPADPLSVPEQRA